MRDLITTAEIWKEGGMYTSYCPELDIASCGHTTEEARKNLQEVITIQLEETKRWGRWKIFSRNWFKNEPHGTKSDQLPSTSTVFSREHPPHMFTEHKHFVHGA